MVAKVKSDFATISTSARQRDNSLYIGFVKFNEDAQRMGRLSVYIPEIGGDPTNKNSWITINYAPPFFGSTSAANLQNNQTMQGSQQSYGWWGIPPDLDNQVLCGFVNGDIARGYFWACIPQQNMNFMVPGLAAGPATSATPSKYLAPTVEYNKLNAQSTSSPSRPVYTPLANGLNTQGLAGDFERGPSSSSPRREAPSKVFGFSTPDGSQLYADDNPANEFIRFRTKSGVQVVIHETNGYVYINSKSGNSWVEISDLGIDLYSINSISLRAQKDFNIRADNNINLDAGGSINLRAGSSINLQAGVDVSVGATSGMTLAVSNGMLQMSSSSDMLQSAGGAWRSEAGADMSMLAGGAMNRTASQISDNGTPAPSVGAASATSLKGATLADTTSTGSSATLNTIGSRMPTHEPFKGHPKSGVPPIVAKPYVEGTPSPSGGTYTTVPSSTSQPTGDGKTAQIPNSDGNQCGTGVGTKKCSDSVYNSIKTASSTTGAPFGSMMAFADTESSFQPSVQNSGSSATGLYQFTSGTWSGMTSQYGGQYNIPSNTPSTDQDANAVMGGAYYQQNAQTLQNAGISNPSCGQVYMCHLLGPSGGTNFINAATTNPDAPLGPPAISSAAVSGNPALFAGCSTVGQAYNKINGQMNAKAAAYDAQAGLPSPCSRDGATPSATTTNPDGSTTTTLASNNLGASSTGYALSPTTPPATIDPAG